MSWAFHLASETFAIWCLSQVGKSCVCLVLEAVKFRWSFPAELLHKVLKDANNARRQSVSRISWLAFQVDQLSQRLPKALVCPQQWPPVLLPVCYGNVSVVASLISVDVLVELQGRNLDCIEHSGGNLISCFCICVLTCISRT